MVFRVNKTKDYAVMSKFHLKEKEMSLKAKGLLSQMLSLPDEWDYSIKGLAAINKESEETITTILKELQKFHYLVVTKKMPNETKSGRIEYLYDIYEKPYTKKQEGKKQGVVLQGVENQEVENSVQLNTKQLNTNKLNNKNINTDDIYNYYENFIGIMNSTTYQTIESYLQDGMTEELIKLAIDKAVDNGARKWSYVRAILNNWNSSNIKTVSDYEKEEKPGKSVLDKWAEEMEKKENGGKGI